MKFHLFQLPNGFQGWLLHLLLFDYHLFIVFHAFLLFFTLNHNPMLGSHMGGFMGSLQTSILLISVEYIFLS